MSQSLTRDTPHIVPAKTYLIGFAFALALTLAAFALVEWRIAQGYQLIAILLLLALIQTVVQLWYFLHIGRAEKPNWNLIFLANTIGIILLIVIASIWIMNSLHYRMMSPQDMNQHMMEHKDDGF